MQFVAAAVIAILTFFGGKAIFQQSGANNTNSSVSQQTIGNGCEANLEWGKEMTVKVDTNKEQFYADKNGKTYVLIKRSAPIPAWKVIRGKHKDRRGGKVTEMEKMAIVKTSNITDSNIVNNAVYIGLGHCNGEPGEDCVDPLVQDYLFVVDEAGVNITPMPHEVLPPGAFEDKTHEEGTNQKDYPGYYWKFHVFIDKDYFSNIGGRIPTNDDLPCWTRLPCGSGDVMGENRKKMAQANVCDQLTPGQANPQSLNVQSQNSSSFHPPAMVYKDEIAFTDQSLTDKLETTYIFYQETTTDPVTLGAQVVGTATYNYNQVEISYLESDLLLFVTAPNRTNFYSYMPISQVTESIGKSLQLGTFSPNVSLVADYEWWTPACKPAIYLYPKKTTAVSVNVKPNGYITQSIPEHGQNGWTVLANPDGSIINLTSSYGVKTYPYLYYEADIAGLAPPPYRWTIEKNNLPQYFKTVLPQLGLNQKEQNDFLDYWLKKLDEADRWSVGLVTKENLNRFETIDISPKPDNFIRIRFYFKKAADNEPTTPVNTWQVNSSLPSRNGFTVVDWGGILASGNCQITSHSE